MDDLINIGKINKLSPEKGKVLISEPFMEDDFFKRSVIYLCEHNEDGSFGFVVNNILSVTLSELVEDIDSPDFKVGFGGPINSSHMYYLHTLGNQIEDSFEVAPGIYTGGNFDEIKTLINTGVIDNKQIRFFLGYSGWEADQLKDEMENKSWIVGEAKIEDIIENQEKNLWKKILTEMGGKFKMLSNFPEDPTLN